MQGFTRLIRWRKVSAITLTFALLFSTVLTGIGSQNASAEAGSIPPANWYQNFEQPGSAGNNGIASIGSASTVTISGKTPGNGSTKSAKLVQSNDNNPSGGAWDTNVYGFIVTPQEDVTVAGEAYYDASNYNVFSFYILDADAHNPNVVFKDADGKMWSPETKDVVSVKNEWTRLSISLDKTKDFDFSRIVSISLGEYWGWNNQYYFDELYFAQLASDLPPAYPEGPLVPAKPIMYQSFDTPGINGKYGLNGQGSATVAQHTASPTAYSSSSGSLKSVQNTYTDGDGIEKNGEWNTGIYGVHIAPQDDSKVSGNDYMDVSNYKYLMFYVKDTSKDAGVNMHVVFKDAEGAVWDTDSGQTVKTQSNQWVKMIVPLDKTKLNFAKLQEIQLGTYWGWGNVYYYDDLYFGQNMSDASPAYEPERTSLFNDFEHGSGFSAGSGASAETAEDVANAAEKTSVKLTTTGSGWPYVGGTYLGVVPKAAGSFNASGYHYLAFYFKDMQGSNGVEIRMKDADGGVLDKWGTTNSTKNKWVKMLLPLDGATGIDLSNITSIDIGVYNAGTYLVDDIFFAMDENDELPGFIGESANIGAIWYQSFETKGQDGLYGISAGTGVQTSVSGAESANAYHSSSVKALVAADSTDPGVNGVNIKPQALGASINKEKPYDYRPEIDATNFSHLIFYVWDAQGGQNLRVQLKDAEGKVIESTTTSKLTDKDSWSRIVVPLDKSANFRFSQLSQVTVTPEKAGIYYFDEFYLGKSANDDFPNAGYTQLVLKDVNGESMPFANGLPLGSYEKQKDRTYISLNGNWNKLRTSLNSELSASARNQDRIEGLEKEADGKQKADFDDSKWKVKALPMPEDEISAYESVNGPENKSDKSGYQSGVWYRKHFSVDSSMKGVPAQLNFLGVNYFADVWINGKYAGGHQGGYTPFSLEASSLLNYGGDNVIAVRVDNPKWDTFANGEILPYAKSDWFNYTGILRDAYFEFLPDSYIVRSDIRTLSTDGTLSIRTFLNNTSTADENVQLTYSVYEANVLDSNRLSEYGQDLVGQMSLKTTGTTLTVAANKQAVQTLQLKVPSPKLWSPASPNLYILKVEQKVGGTVKDTFYTQFGIRTLEADGVKIKLNGELAPFLAGVGYTEDSSDKGPSLDLATRYSDLQKIKEDVKANFVRTGHFPHSLPTYQYSDRIGLAIWQEIPAYWYSGDAFDLQRQRGQAKQMLEEMIYSNYNRPSIWFDGVSNESAGQLQRVNYITELKDTAHAIDGTRLVGQSAVANPYKGESDHSHSAADVIGMTMYFGAFYGKNMDVDTQEEIERIHALYPDKPIIATEYGYWSGDESPADTKQTKLFTGTFNAFARTATVTEEGKANPSGLLSGAAWWTAYNWYTNITGLQTMGLYHMDRTKPKQVTDIVAERYNRYTHTSSGAIPHPVGISTWFQSFESGKGVVASGNEVKLESVIDSPGGGASKSMKITVDSAADGAYAAIVPQGGMINSDLSVYNYLNFYAKDSVGGRPLSITLVDAEGNTWTSSTEERTVKNKWTLLSLSLQGAQGFPLSSRKLNTMAIKQVRIGLAPSDQLLIDDIFAATFKDSSLPPSYPIGASGWFQSFEEAQVQVTQGMNALATVDRTFGVNPGGTGSVKLEVTGDGGAPGANGQSVIITPQGGAASLDASDFNYLVFYVKDMQGSNTVHVTFVDTDGTVSIDNWTDVSAVKGQWTKVYIPLSKTSADVRKLKEIRLAEWNPGTYYFDDLYFAEYPSDEIPATYTEQIPEKPQPEGQIKVAAIGDSITAGAGLEYAGVTSYPAQLQSMLGDKYAVKNFGVSGSTLQKKGDKPYWNEAAFEASKKYAPDIVVIQLGTNDTKSGNWSNGSNSFLSDYKEMIEAYKELPSHPKVYVNLPPWIFNDDPTSAYGIVSSVLQNGVIPLVKKAAEASGSALIDVNAATADQSVDFPDKIHPNPKGAWTIANTVAKAIKGAAGTVGDTEICIWKGCKAGAYSIVYDDGIYDSVLRFASLHEKYSLVGTLALISGWIDKSYNDVGASTGTWAQWKALLDKGYFDAASHTVTHRDLTTLTTNEMKTEFKDSIAQIELKTGHKPESLALPYNNTNSKVSEEAAKYFVAARQGGNNAGNTAGTTRYYGLSSTMAESTTTVKSLNDWTDFGIAKGNWLVLTGHGNEGEGWSSPPLSLFDNHYGYVHGREDALWNGTLTEVGKYLRERQDVSIEAKAGSSNSIEVKLTGSLDKAVYNESLTLRTKIPADWTKVTATQGSLVQTLQPVHEGAGNFVYYEAVPGQGSVIIARKQDGGIIDSSPGSGIVSNTDSKAVLSLDQTDIEKAINAGSADAKGIRTIRFTIPASLGKDTFELRVPASYLIGQEKLRMEFVTPTGQLTLPGNMFEGQAAGSAKEISIMIGSADLSGASETVKGAVGNHPVIELHAAIDGKLVEWRNDKVSVTFRAAYKASDDERTNPERLTFWQIKEDGTAAPVVSGRYDKVSGEMTFATHHFSRYAVVSVAKTFGDLERFGWAQQAIEALASKGAINGTAVKTFSPEQQITRADAIVMIMRVLDLHAERSKDFKDVLPGAYYYEDVNEARTLGVVQGQGGNQFNPMSLVSRQEMMIMLHNAMKAAGLQTAAGSKEALMSYKDSAAIAKYAEDSVSSMLVEGLFQGNNGYLKPASPLTRAEAAVVLYRLYNPKR
ncbi:hypothetical protein Back11_57910 [Paenibacillus baekrokdamisoli]|uniref:Uncharacterized protein n=1 Tax=Paenibacillus baekrokdamisoli TaxID=1712516 RepID=A0A3G9J112_9BACL|nr:GDSL-type esterase/lipase family protein [Paenibacillus baekrokdamisoli]MBB3072888.1 lysophospholipase L1-like esterase [Paenibacillus baekrokdamisoli]BBH24446.1 hypothetical protein Back11_57910 [Paenibacillus baekrokdamisoli]